jgi:hypothetical protein
MQQGRVLLDADFNELVEIIDRRFRAETMDIIGRCVVPKQTPDGFRIQFSGSTITIGRGRFYADGLLAENHGKVPLEFDLTLAEERGTLPIPYLEQPYLPNANVVSPLPADGGPHLVYVDVWQREVTFIEEPDLVEKAVGVDTATRLQTVWQVKVHPNVGNVTCTTPDDQIPGWSDIIRPSAGRLTTTPVGVPADTDPCVVNPTGGFRGTENRLYRVEIHSRGPLGTATFKWSRDNASVATSVTAINAGLDVLTVARTGRDAVLRFQPDDWVEITDDFHEFAGLPGEMRKVLLVDDVTQTLTLTTPLPAGAFDTTTPGSRHTRVRRWDQKGQVFDAANNVVADVDANGGVIPVPASGSLVLEDGIQVEFNVAQPGGEFHTGDYWVIAARTVDASIDLLVQAPPKGIHHHFCRLALITFPDSVTDCRTLWPPDFGEQGCDCTECVTAESHNNGTLTIQMAIDRVKATGGKVCLGPGVFNLGAAPVQIHAAQSIQLQGHGWRTLLIYTGTGPAISVSGSIGVDIDLLAVIAFTGDQASVALGAQNSALLRVQRCLLAQVGRGSPLEAAVGLNGFLLEASFRDNILFGSTGVLAIARNVDLAVAVLPGARLSTFTFGLRIEDNLVAALSKGISLEGFTLLAGETSVSGNSVYGCRRGSILVGGLVLSDLLTSSRLDVIGNELLLSGDGIIVATDHTRVCENDIGVLRGQRDQAAAVGGSGIVVAPGISGAVDRLQVIGNRITAAGGDAISLRAPVESGMIKQNVIDGVRGGGIIMEEASQANQLSIENNQILRVGQSNDQQTALAAIRASRVRQLEVASNSIDQFALPSVQNPTHFGIEVVACNSVRISGNDLSNIGPPGAFLNQGAGILVQGPFDRVDVMDNSVRRSLTAPTAPNRSSWHAIRIAQPVTAPAAGVVTSVLFPFVVAVSGSFIAVGANRVVVLPPGKEIVAVRGNLLEAYGVAATVSVGVASSCVFSDNRCLLETPSTPTPVADITSGAAIVNANFVRRLPASDNSPALLLGVGQGPFTMLGNIFSGLVRVNNAPLDAPWSPLNVITFS